VSYVDVIHVAVIWRNQTPPGVELVVGRCASIVLTREPAAPITTFKLGSDPNMSAASLAFLAYARLIPFILNPNLNDKNESNISVSVYHTVDHSKSQSILDSYIQLKQATSNKQQ
jgi:hypothetical protein